MTAAAAKREVDRPCLELERRLDENFWYVAAGIRKNFFGFGDTVLFGEYSEHNDFVERGTSSLVNSSDVTHWGVGINQYIDAAAMEVFLTYKNYSAGCILSAGAIRSAARTSRPSSAAPA